MGGFHRPTAQMRSGRRLQYQTEHLRNFLMITKGQQVWIRPEWADPGDNTLERYAAEDESGGRVLVVTIDPQFTYFPTRIERTAHLTTDKP